MVRDARLLVFTTVISLANKILFGLGPLVGNRAASAWGKSLEQDHRVAGA